MDKAFTRVDETFEAIRDSLNQQAINNIARKLAQDLRRAQQARIRSQKFGERDQVAPGIFTDYPVRELLGISQADERLIYNTVLGRIAEAVR
ncbi:hypothetical protein ACVUSR_04135 [Escherichia coli]|uniref:hypothetical protein n=1 Tax=Escherichia coli TaxID=562 RepID=UPI001F37CDF8|nr:hypothetical protein [Escherichia coli]MCF6557148.1 hypothetical protein [Escherichia coli]